MKFISILTFFFLLFFSDSLSENLYLIKDYSENMQYYTERIYYNFCRNTFIPFVEFGQTKIYSVKDKKMIYKVDKYLDRCKISNDGLSIIEYNNDSVSYYKAGLLIKSYSKSELLKCDENIEDCDLFYNNPDLRVITDTLSYRVLPKSSTWNYGLHDSNGEYIYNDSAEPNLVFADKFTVFSFGDTLFIVSPKLKVLKFSFATGNYDEYDFLSNVNYLKTIAKKHKHETECLDYQFCHFPNLKDGQTLLASLEKKFDYLFKEVYVLEESDIEDLDYEGLNYHYIFIGGLLDRNGNFEIKKISSDSIKEISAFKDYIYSLKFDSLKMPQVVDKWYYRTSIQFRNKDIKQARAEQLKIDSLENIKIKLDTIDGEYIPKNIQECMGILDKFFSPRIKRELQAMKYQNGLGHYSMEYYDIMDKKWHLIAGSHLARYFNELGIFSPGDMVHIILHAYYNYVHNLPITN